MGADETKTKNVGTLSVRFMISPRGRRNLAFTIKFAFSAMPIFGCCLNDFGVDSIASGGLGIYEARSGISIVVLDGEKYEQTKGRLHLSYSINRVFLDYISTKQYKSTNMRNRSKALQYEIISFVLVIYGRIR